MARYLKEEDYKSVVVKNIMQQQKLILSNLAGAHKTLNEYKNSIDIDLKIITYDPKFEKSYARLLYCYLKLNDLERANYYADYLKNHFSHEVYSKCDNLFNLLSEANKQHDKVY